MSRRARAVVGWASLLAAAGAFALVLAESPWWAAMLKALVPGQQQYLYPLGTPASYAIDHVRLVGISSAFTIVAGVVIGVAATRRAGRPFLPVVSDLVSLGQTFPPVAVLAVAVPALGFGSYPAIVALVLYGLLPVVRNTIAGIDGVPADELDAARGMGMTAGQVLVKVELPLAARVILAGIRTSVIINVGTAAIAAAVGAGGFGVPIIGGLVAQNPAFVLEGAIPTAVLAVLLDGGLRLVESSVVPAGLQQSA